MVSVQKYQLIQFETYSVDLYVKYLQEVNIVATRDPLLLNLRSSLLE